MTTCRYDPDKYYVDLESRVSTSNHFNQICVLTLGKHTGTTFPVTISPALYDTGAARSCMSYETFFSLGLDLDDKTVPRVCTASGTDMGAVRYTTFDFQINGHPLPNNLLCVIDKADL